MGGKKQPEHDCPQWKAAKKRVDEIRRDFGDVNRDLIEIIIKTEHEHRVADAERDEARVTTTALQSEWDQDRTKRRQAWMKFVAACGTALKLPANAFAYTEDAICKQIANLHAKLLLTQQGRDDVDAMLNESRRVSKEFIQGCAELLGLPDLDEHSEYCGGAIREGIEGMKKKLSTAELTADGVIEGSAEWEDDCKTAQKQVKELQEEQRKEKWSWTEGMGVLGKRCEKAEAELLIVKEAKKKMESSCASLLADMGVKRDRMISTALFQLQSVASCNHGEVSRMRCAMEKINEIRNDIIARQIMGWSAHIYPLVAALDEAGFQGAHYEDARAALEATIASAREMAAGVCCKYETAGKGMEVKLAEEFAEILFPLLQALEFYARPGNWDVLQNGCDLDLGSRARLALGHHDMDVSDRGCGSCGNDVTQDPDGLKRNDPNPCKDCEDGRAWTPRRLGASMNCARELVAVAWCQKGTEDRVMDVALAEAFAEILLPFLEALERIAEHDGDGMLEVRPTDETGPSGLLSAARLAKTTLGR